MSAEDKDQVAKTALGVEFVNMEDEDQVAVRAIPLDTLLGSYEAVLILP